MKKLFTLVLFVCFHLFSFSQFYTTAGGTATTGSSSVLCVNGAFNNPSNICTAPTTDYADFSLLAGAGCTYWLQSNLTGTAPAGYYTGFRVNSSNIANALTSLRVKTFLGGSPRETASGAGLVSLLSGGDYCVYFLTALSHDAVRIEFSSLAAAVVDTKIYYGFSQSTDPLTVLPLQFYSVQALREKGRNTICWKIEADESLSYFSVEKSNNGQDFAATGRVQGNATGHYRFDDYATPATAYYRVKAFTKTGGIYTSAIVKVKAEPFNSSITVELKASGALLIHSTAAVRQPAMVYVYNSDGQLITEAQKMLLTNGTVNLPTKSSKMYLVCVYSKEELLYKGWVMNVN